MRRFRRILSFVLATVMALSVSGFSLTVSAADRNITVGTSKQVDFNSIQAALDSITFETSETSRVNIKIEPGVYTEEVTVDKPYVTFTNAKPDDRRGVVIAYDKASVHEDDPSKSKGTQGSATVTVTAAAHDFSAYGITFENTYNLDQPRLGEVGRAQSQAVAIVTLSDRVTFDSCKFIGRQDTLYLKGASKGQDVYGSCNDARVYLKNCYIEGTVDYIFGDATAYFEDCTLNMAYYKNGGHYTAANTTLFSIGYVFSNCTLTVDEELYENTANVDLGRPWQADSSYPNYGSQTVFINCKMADRIADKGFSLWSDATVANKIRYYEYGTTDLEGNPADLSKRADYVKILTDEQAAAYTPENILLGTDGWNPRGLSDRMKPETIVPADITLRSYNIDVPLQSTYAINGCVLPKTAANKRVIYSSSDESVASVDANGIITGNKKGSCIITAETEQNGFSAYAYVNVTSAETFAPEIESLTLSKTADIYPDDVIEASYSFKLPSDNKADNSIIRWYSGSAIVKQGGKDYAYYYEVQADDVGKQIRCEVLPRTTTSYGSFGNTVSASTEAVNAPAYSLSETYIHEEFASLSDIDFTSSGAAIDTNFTIYKGEDYDAIGSATSDTAEIISNAETGGTLNLTARMRFNPEKTGFSSSDSFDILTNYDTETNSYYRFSLVKGADSNSVKMYVYEVKDGAEALLGANETDAKDVVLQNSGDANPYFNINIVVTDTRLKYTLTLQGETSALAKVIVDKEEASNAGKIAVRTYGKAGVALIDSLIVKSTDEGEAYDESKIQVFLAGDSTVKTYGITRSTGGWGEYLGKYFDADKVEIVNKAEGGRSSRSFINQGRLENIKEHIGAGDYLFIQFGHNDCSDDEAYLEERYCPLGKPDEGGVYPTTAGVLSPTPDDLLGLDTSYPYGDEYYSYDCGGTYKWYLKQYIDAAREKGAIPVLVTPVTRKYFGSDGKIKPHHDDSTTADNAYVTAMKQLGAEENVPVLDLFNATVTYYNQIGDSKASLLHDIKADGKTDGTHHSKYGAYVIAGMVKDLVNSSSLELKAYTKASVGEVKPNTNLRKATAFILGDSTACNYDTDANHSVKRGGWGMYLGEYTDDRLTVRNLAISGRSSKSFTTEENYQTFLSEVKKGDYVFIGFGHNDAKAETEEDKANRRTDFAGSKETEGSFKYYLYNYYIKAAEDAGAIPILLSPVSVREFEKGEVTDYHGQYDDAVRELAAETGVTFIDMTNITADLYNAMGESGSEKLFAYYTDTEKGIDNIHFNSFGGRTIAGLVVSALMGTDCAVKNYVVENYDANYITRGEFITALMNLVGKTDVPLDNFADVDPGKPYANAVGNAKVIGVTAGDTDGNFRPEDYLTRQDMFTLTYNFLLSQGITLTAKENRVDDFADSSYVAPYAKAPLNALITAGIISGTQGGKLNPAAYADKGAAASVVNQLYKILAENEG